MPIRFIHTSDWQIGMTRHFLDEEAQARFGAARIEAINRLGSLADEHDADFVVVSGDAFDSNHLDRRTVVRALEALDSVHVPFYILPGNHDPLNPGSIYDTPLFRDRCPDNVHVLRDTGPVQTDADVEVVGAPWTTKRPLDDLAWDAVYDLEPDGKGRVLVAHGGVDTMAPDPDNPATIETDRLEERIGEDVLSYVALGDRHSTTRVGDTGRIWYSGAPEPTDFGEEEPGNALLVTLEDGEVEVEKLRTARWRFEEEEFQLEREADLDHLEDWLEGRESKARTVVRLTLEGTLNLEQKSRLDTILDEGVAPFASVQVWGRRTDLAVLPDEGDVEQLELSGFASEAFDRLEKKAQGSGEDARTAEEALGLLYRLSQGDKP